jgi:type IX secretion system substrate protein
LFKLSGTTATSYASTKITSDQTITIGAQNTWVTVGNVTANGVNNWSYLSNVLTPANTNADGYYLLEYSASVSVTNAGDTYEMGVFIGNSSKAELTSQRKLAATTSTRTINGNGIFNVNGSESTITLKIRNLTSANNLIVRRALLGTEQLKYVDYDTPLPITLADFNAEVFGHSIILKWATASETENMGFNIYRKTNEEPFELIASYTGNSELIGNGTVTETNQYQFVDENVKAGERYQYLLADVSYHTDEIKHVDFIREAYIPVGLTLGEAYPNPFNPQCSILYALDINEHVRIDLFDISGKAVKTLVDRDHISGNYELVVNEPSLNSGLYVVRIQVGDQVKTRKIMMLK